jgi:hypothetical protein
VFERPRRENRRPDARPFLEVADRSLATRPDAFVLYEKSFVNDLAEFADSCLHDKREWEFFFLRADERKGSAEVLILG